jgi:CRP/FNR family transcriptional regulator, cyclic AMP receptor protein
MLARQQVAVLERPVRRKSEEVALPPSSSLPGPTALFLSETIEGLNEGANFLSRLSPSELARMRASGRQLAFKAGEPIFSQGTPHEGIFLIDSGRVRVFYSAPSGREITLAYWTQGHFIGGPEICGGGIHMWSGEALEECRITILPSAAVQSLITQVPNFALCLIEGLVAKGKCYSAMAQMLGTRSVIARLAQFLVSLSELYGVADESAIIINRKITHDQIAAMVGSTRQWVTMMLKRFKKNGTVSVDARYIRIDRPERLKEMLFKDAG